MAHAGGGSASAGAAGTWERAPTPPLGPRERAVGVWTGARRSLGPDALGRPLARAATLRPGARSWRVLPDSEDVLYGRLQWVRAGSKLVSPELDMAAGRWLLIPRLPTGWRFQLGGATAVGMNRKLLAFGGPRYGRNDRGRLVNEAWIWSPPPAEHRRRS